MHCLVHYLLAMLDIKDLSEIINTTRLCNKVEINNWQPCTITVCQVMVEKNNTVSVEL